MRKFLLLPSTVIIFLLFSCSKSLEDRLIGSWQLEDAWKRVFLGRDHFQTGYESGIFTFMENGAASYTSNTDTLTGFWRANNYTNSYYNSSTDQWESRQMRRLRISLINFQQNRWLEWEFDNFSFKNDWGRIKAEQFSLGYDKVYEFGRR